MDLIPKKNTSYKDVNYWNERYAIEETYDWFKSYDSFKHLIKENVSLEDKILMLGCGNSNLSEQMYGDGYHNIVNIDYSDIVIGNMSKKYADLKKMSWKVMDMRDMSFPEDSFDVIFEKGTLDAMLVEDSPWHISEENVQLIDTILTQVSRILTKNGRFISVTFTQPHFRLPMYVKEKYEWDVEQLSFGDCVQYFFYVCTKGKPLKPSMLERYSKKPES